MAMSCKSSGQQSEQDTMVTLTLTNHIDLPQQPFLKPKAIECVTS